MLLGVFDNWWFLVNVNLYADRNCI